MNATNTRERLWVCPHDFGGNHLHSYQAKGETEPYCRHWKKLGIGRCKTCAGPVEYARVQK